MRYAHTNIISHDWKELADFYIEVFQCQLKPPIRKQAGDWLEKGTGVPGAALEGTHLLLPGHGANGPTLEIYQYSEVIQQSAVMPNQRGLGHLAFEVEDVNTTLEAMEKHGGSRLGEVITREVEGVGILTFTYARDPDGNLIELQRWE